MRAVLLEGNDDLAVLLPIIFDRAGVTLQRVRTVEELLTAVESFHQGDFLIVDCSAGEPADIERCARVLRMTEREVHVLYRRSEAVAPLRVVANGRLVLWPADARLLTLLAKLRERWQRKPIASRSIERAPLSPREEAVLHMAARDMPEQAIADELGLQLSTVKTYLLRVREKWGLATTADLVRAYRLLAAG